MQDRHADIVRVPVARCRVCAGRACGAHSGRSLRLRIQWGSSRVRENSRQQAQARNTPVQCEAAAAILASEGPAPVSVGRQHARSSFVPRALSPRDSTGYSTRVEFLLKTESGYLRDDPGTVTIPQHRFNKTKQHTHTINKTKKHTHNTRGTKELRACCRPTETGAGPSDARIAAAASH